MKKMEDLRQTSRGWMYGCMNVCACAKVIQSSIHTIMLVIILGSTSFAQFKLPEYETVTLDNGLTVYLMEKKDVPLISFLCSI